MKVWELVSFLMEEDQDIDLVTLIQQYKDKIKEADARAQEAEQRRAHTAEARIRLEAQVATLTQELKEKDNTILGLNKTIQTLQTNAAYSRSAVKERDLQIAELRKDK